jgi:hypothetical protein
MRTLALAPGADGGSRNVVSDRLNCRAIESIVASSRPRPSSNTQRGLPENRSLPTVNTLRIRKDRVVVMGRPPWSQYEQ